MKESVSKCTERKEWSLLGGLEDPSLAALCGFQEEKIWHIKKVG